MRTDRGLTGRKRLDDASPFLFSLHISTALPFSPFTMLNVSSSSSPSSFSILNSSRFAPIDFRNTVPLNVFIVFLRYVATFARFHDYLVHMLHTDLETTIQLSGISLYPPPYVIDSDITSIQISNIYIYVLYTYFEHDVIAMTVKIEVFGAARTIGISGGGN